jgi:hypothetical protein
MVRMTGIRAEEPRDLNGDTAANRLCDGRLPFLIRNDDAIYLFFELTRPARFPYPTS